MGGGLTFPSFWRPATATVRIGERVAKGVHLLQVWMIRPMGGEEVAVLYPQDGYWRLRPLAPSGMAPTAFGSSFLIGPVEVEGRPIVKLREVAFDPKSRTFALAFERGGTASVRMAKTDQNRNVLEVAYDGAIDGRPFAALRSMYVTDFNNDVARIAVRKRQRGAGRKTRSWPSNVPPQATCGPGASLPHVTTPHRRIWCSTASRMPTSPRCPTRSKACALPRLLNAMPGAAARGTPLRANNGASRSVRLHRSPSRGNGLRLGTEPALAFVRIDLDLRVPGTPGHVIDLAALGDVALDRTARRRLLFCGGPPVSAKLPRRHRLALPDTQPLGLGGGLLLHVAAGIRTKAQA